MNTTTVITKWVYAVVRITLGWWIANIPYLFLIVLTFGVNNEGQAGALLVTGLILVPFVLMPGTIGALGIGREFFNHENEFPLISTFWKYYKRDYKNGMKVGGIFLGILGIFYTAYSYYSQLLGTVFGLVFIFFMAVAIFFFIILLTIIVDRTNSFTGYFRITAQLVSRHPVLMISMVFEVFLTVYLCGIFMPSLLIFVCPGIIVLLATHFYIQCLKQEVKKQTLIMNEKINVSYSERISERRED
jgi:uncharacterized membrane protein YesL